MMVEKTNYFISIFFCSLALSVIAISAPLIPMMEPDSQGYLNFASYRPAGYPLILKLILNFSSNINHVIYVQTALYLLSLFILLNVIQIYLKNKILIFIFGLLVALNVFYQTFHTSILTESLSFSLLNLLLSTILISHKIKLVNLASFLAILTGCILALKPAMITVAVSCPLLILLISKKFKIGLLKPMCLYIGILFLSVLAELTAHKFWHEERSSLLPVTMIGKAAIISADPKFKAPKLSSHQKIWMDEYDKLFNEVGTYLSTEKNPFLKANLRSNFEVFGQYQAEPLILKITNLKPLNDNDKIQIGLKTIAANLSIYVAISVEHITSLWFVNEVVFFAQYFNNSLRELSHKELNGVIPNLADTLYGNFESHSIFRDLLNLFVFPAFLFFGALSFIVFIWSNIYCCLKFFTSRFYEISDDLLICTALSFSGWSYLIFVGFVNISSARYLMPFLPFFIVAAITFTRYILQNKAVKTAVD